MQIDQLESGLKFHSDKARDAHELEQYHLSRREDYLRSFKALALADMSDAMNDAIAQVIDYQIEIDPEVDNLVDQMIELLGKVDFIRNHS